jgi:hypothetical protein
VTKQNRRETIKKIKVKKRENASGITKRAPNRINGNRIITANETWNKFKRNRQTPTKKFTKK